MRVGELMNANAARLGSPSIGYQLERLAALAKDIFATI
jgi:hypothetical protein